MIVRNRIAAIRLSEKIERNPEYAKKIGVAIVNGKTENVKKDNNQDRISIERDG